MNRFWLDLLERAARTFIQAFAAALGASELSAGWSVWSSAGVAGLAAAAAAVMAVLTKPIGDTTSASVLPAPVVVASEPVEQSLVGEPVRAPIV